MLIHIEWQYLQRIVTEVGFLMGPIEDALREAFFPALFGGEEVGAELREILGHSMNMMRRFMGRIGRLRRNCTC